MWDYGYQYQKRRSDVTQIPHTVNLAPYVWHDPSQPPLGQCTHELTGVVVHSSYYFHYYAFVRRNGRCVSGGSQQLESNMPAYWAFERILTF
jgi:hypothetical protein